MRRPARLARLITVAVTVAALLGSVAGSSSGSMGGAAGAGGTHDPGDAAPVGAVSLPGQLPPTVPVVTRTVSGLTANGGPVLQVRVGATTYTGSATTAAPGCHAQVWFLVLDRFSLQPFPTLPRDGIYGDPCAAPAWASSVAAKVNLIGSQAQSLPDGDEPLVVVNTIQTGGGAAVEPDLGTALRPLGFASPTVDLGALDLAGNSVTGIGSPGLDPGSALLSIGWSGYDAGTGTTFVPTLGSVQARFVGTVDGGYHALDLEVESARSYTGDGAGGPGSGGWQVGAGWTQQADGSWRLARSLAAAAPMPPGTAGGFQLVVLDNRVAAPAPAHTLVQTARVNRTYWTNTGAAANDATAWAALASDLLAYDRFGSPVLLRSIGAAKAAVSTSATDPALRLATALARVGGLYAAVAQMGPADDLTVVLPGTSLRDVTPAQRLLRPYTFSTRATPGADVRHVAVLLGHVPDGEDFEPVAARVTGADPTDTNDPYTFAELVAQPATAWAAWPNAGQQQAYAAWSRLLCGCDATDFRRNYLTGYVGDAPSVYQANVDHPPAGILAADWTAVGQRLQTEAGWVTDILSFYADARTTGTQAAGGAATGLLGAWQQVAQAIQDDTGWDAAHDKTHVVFGVVSDMILNAEGAVLFATDLAVLLGARRAGLGWASAVSAIGAEPKGAGTEHARASRERTQTRGERAGRVTGLATAAWFGVEEFLWHGEGPDRTLDLPVANLGSRLAQRMADQDDGLAIELGQVLSDPGRLAAMGRGLAAGTPAWAYDGTMDAQTLAQLTSDLKAALFRALLPLAYQLRGQFAATPAQAAALGTGRSVLVEPSPLPTLRGVGDATTRWTAQLVSLKDGRPAGDALLAAIQAQGVWLPEVFEDWPTTHVGVASDGANTLPY